MDALLSWADKASIAMERGDWESALLAWAGADSDELLRHPMYLHGFARTCEVLEKWPLHREILLRALERYPGDWEFVLRLEFNDAMASFKEQRWVEAFELLSRLVRCKPLTHWPFRMSFYRWQALLQIKLEGVESPVRRIHLLDRWSMSKSEGVRPAQIAGLEMVVELMDWDAELKTDFMAVCKPILDYLKREDGLLWHVTDPWLKARVQSLAEFVRLHPLCMETLPVSLIGFFASFFLIFGCAEHYIWLRRCFVSGLDRPEFKGREGQRLVELMYQVLLANELGNELDFQRLKNIAYRDFLGDGRDQSLIFIKYSELYHRRRDAIGFEFLDEDAGDIAFVNYLRGKSVAIVGPVDVGLDSGLEIDGFDVVVRLNHKRHHKRNVRRFGTRTDVSYYVYNDLLKNGLKDCQAALSDLQFAVLDALIMKNCEFPERGQCRIRTAANVGSYGCNPLLMGYATAIQRLLMDLVRFPIGRIKVFNANLYLAKGYEGNYCEGPAPEYMRAFSLHDPLSNFIFTQRLFKLRSIEVDSVLCDILSLDAFSYAEALFQVHVE